MKRTSRRSQLPTPALPGQVQAVGTPVRHPLSLEWSKLPRMCSIVMVGPPHQRAKGSVRSLDEAPAGSLNETGLRRG